MISIDFENDTFDSQNDKSVALSLTGATENGGPDVSSGLIEPLLGFTNRLFLENLGSKEWEYLVESYVPYACTFTFPDDTQISTNYLNKKGTFGKKYVLMEHADIKDQRRHAENKISMWINNVNKMIPKSTPIFNWFNVYFELTKKGRIHGHGLFFINNGYTMGISQIMTLQWSRITKGDMRAMSKIGASGRNDFAFDRCNNIEKWLEYCSKEHKKKE